MAKYGAKYIKWAPTATTPDDALPTYGTAESLSKLVKVTETPNFSEGKQFGDNELCEYAKEFVDADLAIEVTDQTPAGAAALYGAAVDSGTSGTGNVTYKSTDTQPYGGLAFYACKMVNGVKKYVGHFFPLVKASLSEEDFETKGDSITFVNSKINFKALACNSGAWHITSAELTTEAAAKTWVDGRFS